MVPGGTSSPNRVFNRRTACVQDSHHHHASRTRYLDDWQIPGHPSKILRLTYQIEGQQEQVVSIDGVIPRQMGWKLDGPVIEVPANKSVEVSQHYKETKRRFDEHSIAFSTAAKNPKISVTFPDKFGWRPGFPHRRDPMRNDFVRNVQLDGTLLPHQTIAIQWWDKEAMMLQ